MNFQLLPPVEQSKALLDVAFRKAREKGTKDLVGNWLQKIRAKECLKLDVTQDVLVQRLEKILLGFPQFAELSPFYQKLLPLTLDFPQLKKSLGAVRWAQQKIPLFHRQYVRKIQWTKERPAIGRISKEYYGRVSSLLKQIDGNLRFLEQARILMRSYPDVKEMFTVCIYGFPNVGKTTLLNRLTGADAKVAAYAFTTKGINVGYFTVQGKTVQVLDVPGTLARPDKMNNIERIAELAVQELAAVVIYVFDLTGESGFSREKQEQLRQQLGRDKKVLVYLSKRDLLAPAALKEFSAAYPFLTVEQLKGEIEPLA